ncbi:MAG TPA: D-alanyl-D-alanine carboxypeptidase family protein [Ornithinibacter sp.]|nr:D-alanyl-D-alanine carboxypeptidase family protein [Ornithinibacter sp.]
MRRRPLTLAVPALAAVLALGMPQAVPRADAATAGMLPLVGDPSVSRVAGADRYATSVAATKAAFPTGTTPAVVYLVSGTSPWESLSATPAAVYEGGAVLLVRPDGIPSVVVTELERLAPASIVVVGSTASLSDAVLSAARSYAPDVQRVGGSSRYQTAEAIVRHAFPAGSAETAWVATGRVWTDGLAAGAAAASHRSPLLTVDGSASTLPSATVDLIADLGLTSVTIVGGSGAVSAAIEAQLDGILGSSQVTRATGADRYAVAARVNALAYPDLAAGSAYVANGRDFVNPLAGAFLAGLEQRPLYYTVPFCVPAAVRPTLASDAVTRLVVLGGEGSVRSLVEDLAACRSTTTASSVWVLVNKKNAVRPKTFVPSNLVVPSVTYADNELLRSDAASAVATMFTAARFEGAGRMSIASGYRSYSTQYSVYWNRVSTNGQAYADAWIARPGYSEHQTGLSLDIAPVGDPSCSAHTCIGSTPQGSWLRTNSWRFGFVLRYESGWTSWTGYHSEPWHFRFVGVPLSTAYHRGGWHSYEQFIDEPAAPTY